MQQMASLRRTHLVETIHEALDETWDYSSRPRTVPALKSLETETENGPRRKPGAVAEAL